MALPFGAKAMLKRVGRRSVLGEDALQPAGPAAGAGPGGPRLLLLQAPAQAAAGQRQPRPAYVTLRGGASTM